MVAFVFAFAFMLMLLLVVHADMLVIAVGIAIGVVLVMVKCYWLCVPRKRWGRCLSTPQFSIILIGVVAQRRQR